MKSIQFGTKGETAQVVLERGNADSGWVVCYEVMELVNGRQVRRSFRYWAADEAKALALYDAANAAVVEQRIEAKRAADARHEPLKGADEAELLEP